MLPEGWKIFRGEEIAQKITKGQSPKWQGFEYQKDGAIFITSENVRDGFLDISRPKFLPVEFSNKIKGSQLKKGDVLINLVGASIGRSCLYKKNFPHANINQAVCTFRTNSYADPHFLALFFQYPKTIDRLICGQNASARPNISLGDIKNFEVLLPPLPEQKKIAAILSTWDRAIEGTEKLLANSQQQKKALMQQLLTGKKRLPGFTGEWFHLPFKKVAELIYGKALPEKLPAHTTVYPVYGTGGIISYSGEYLFEGPSIIIGRKGTIDTPRYVNTPFWCIDTTFYCKSIHNNDLKFLYYSICFVKLRRYVEASGVPSLSRDTIYSIPLPLPPSLPEQQTIAAVLTTADEEITALESDLSRLRQEKKALMQQLLTGKRRVKVD